MQGIGHPLQTHIGALASFWVSGQDHRTTAFVVRICKEKGTNMYLINVFEKTHGLFIFMDSLAWVLASVSS